MTPLTENPTVVLQVNGIGEVVASATNVAPDLNIVYTNNVTDFNRNVGNLPFNSRKPLPPQQVLAHGAKH